MATPPSPSPPPAPPVQKSAPPPPVQKPTPPSPPAPPAQPKEVVPPAPATAPVQKPSPPSRVTPPPPPPSPSPSPQPTPPASSPLVSPPSSPSSSLLDAIPASVSLAEPSALPPPPVSSPSLASAPSPEFVPSSKAPIEESTAKDIVIPSTPEFAPEVKLKESVELLSDEPYSAFPLSSEPIHSPHVEPQPLIEDKVAPSIRMEPLHDTKPEPLIEDKTEPFIEAEPLDDAQPLPLPQSALQPSPATEPDYVTVSSESETEIELDMHTEIEPMLELDPSPEPSIESDHALYIPHVDSASYQPPLSPSPPLESEYAAFEDYNTQHHPDGVFEPQDVLVDEADSLASYDTIESIQSEQQEEEEEEAVHELDPTPEIPEWFEEESLDPMAPDAQQASETTLAVAEGPSADEILSKYLSDRHYPAFTSVKRPRAGRVELRIVRRALEDSPHLSKRPNVMTTLKKIFIYTNSSSTARFDPEKALSDLAYCVLHDMVDLALIPPESIENVKHSEVLPIRALPASATKIKRTQPILDIPMPSETDVATQQPSETGPVLDSNITPADQLPPIFVPPHVRDYINTQMQSWTDTLPLLLAPHVGQDEAVRRAQVLGKMILSTLEEILAPVPVQSPSSPSPSSPPLSSSGPTITVSVQKLLDATPKSAPAVPAPSIPAPEALARASIQSQVEMLQTQVSSLKEAKEAKEVPTVPEKQPEQALAVEKHFRIGLPDLGVLLIGSFDSLARDGEDIIIREMKSKVLFKNELRYNLQLAVYAYAYYKMTGVIPARTEVRTFDGSKSIQFQPSAKLVDNLEHMLASFVARLKQGVFSATPSDFKCNMCDYKKVCPSSLTKKANIDFMRRSGLPTREVDLWKQLQLPRGVQCEHDQPIDWKARTANKPPFMAKPSGAFIPAAPVIHPWMGAASTALSKPPPSRPRAPKIKMGKKTSAKVERPRFSSKLARK
eukprot:TRINITY_DN5987_c0_g1_i3.p1 TRINITY_DN5987_c0_g1~~TRINITY_DN5987_c0_g1_i3.p1  ORF type:complete len:954 (+),score=208.61 TRINITY_DN5987_c0_g1_i3:356-3217(+)